MISWYFLLCRRWVPATTESFFCWASSAVWITERRPLGSTPPGFSMNTCLPASIAACKCCARQCGGVTSRTTCTSVASTFLMCVEADEPPVRGNFQGIGHFLAERVDRSLEPVLEQIAQRNDLHAGRAPDATDQVASALSAAADQTDANRVRARRVHPAGYPQRRCRYGRGLDEITTRNAAWRLLHMRSSPIHSSITSDPPDTQSPCSSSSVRAGPMGPMSPIRPITANSTTPGFECCGTRPGRHGFAGRCSRPHASGRDECSLCTDNRSRSYRSPSGR